MGRCFDGSSSMLLRRSQILRGCCFERFEGIDWNTTSNAFLLRPAQIVLWCITNCVTLSLKFFQTLSSQNFTEQRFDRSMIERIFSFWQSSSLLNIIFRTPIKNYYLKRMIFVRLNISYLRRWREIETEHEESKWIVGNYACAISRWRKRWTCTWKFA